MEGVPHGLSPSRWHSGDVGTARSPQGCCSNLTTFPPLQNHSNSDVVSIDCNVKLAPNEEMNLHLRGNLWMKSLKAVSPRKADVWLLRNTPKEPSLGANLFVFIFSCNCSLSQEVWVCVG